MFDQLSSRLSNSLKQLSGRGKLTEDNIHETLNEVKKALLEADVALPVVQGFIKDVQDKAVGQKVLATLNPGQMFVKVVNESLVELMGAKNTSLNLACRPPAVILMAGLQGAGKTTTVAKLAKFLKERMKKRVMVVSADVYRPAAIQQLKVLSEQVKCQFFESQADQKPVDIAKNAYKHAKKKMMDILIVDTAGRTSVDQAMMDEIQLIHQAVEPIETLFTVDAMTGQDAANTAKAFSEALPLTGVVLTKADGDARGGAALSVKAITGKPIKFIGIGEKSDALDLFHPERMASRILGMGDMLSLIEEAERKIDKKKATRLASKLEKGQGFNFNDMLTQFQQLKKMGGMAGILDKLPGMGNLSQVASDPANEKMIKQMEAMILSMTPEERAEPDIINPSRKKRIALGSGRDINDVNRLLKQHKQSQKMFKKLGKGGGKNFQKMMGNIMGGGGPGGLPPGMM